MLAAARGASLIIYEGHVSYQEVIYVPYARSPVPDEFYEEARGAVENHTPDQPEEPVAKERAAVPLPQIPDKPSRLTEPLRRMPAVILQSCDSLDEELLDSVDGLGCVAVIGSVTPIHSGSGSMLVGALAESLLVHGDTLGEALRDAQNYLFCLEDLKAQRGLKEQAKSRRVALSFRLWGDPETLVPAGPPRSPHNSPVAAHWSGRAS